MTVVDVSMVKGWAVFGDGMLLHIKILLTLVRASYPLHIRMYTEPFVASSNRCSMALLTSGSSFPSLYI